MQADFERFKELKTTEEKEAFKKEMQDKYNKLPEAQKEAYKKASEAGLKATVNACNNNRKLQFIIMERIDNLDRQILEIISQNARIPFKDVAAECGVSRAAIHQRVQRLIDLGVIVGSGYHVNPKSLGYRTCTYVGIKLEKGSMYKSVVAELQKIPEIVECHFTTGPYTMLTKLYACDNEHLMDLLNNKMQEIPGVVATETLISLEQSIKKEIPIRVEK